MISTGQSGRAHVLDTNTEVAQTPELTSQCKLGDTSPADFADQRPRSLDREGHRGRRGESRHDRLERVGDADASSFRDHRAGPLGLEVVQGGVFVRCCEGH